MVFPKNFIEFLNERSIDNETITVINVLEGLEHYYPEVMNRNKCCFNCANYSVSGHCEYSNEETNIINHCEHYM